MLRNTFCHIAGVGLQTERSLWDAGIHDWQDLRDSGHHCVSPRRYDKIARGVERSIRELDRRNAQFFASGMSGKQHWRLFPEFSDNTAYLDIETTGLDFNCEITTIALYDGRSVRHFVNGQNLRDFKKCIQEYDLLVTYNGKCFDIPFIERFFRICLDKAHIDLRYLLYSLGYSGGLKMCEKKLKLHREGLEEVDGYFAVLLWDEYKRNGDARALETLLAYNIQDVLSLEKLLAISYSKKLKETPFKNSHQIKVPTGRRNPFKPHAATIRKIRERFFFDVDW